MKPFRVLMMLTILLATTSAVHAQSPSAASLEALRRVLQEQCPVRVIKVHWEVVDGPQAQTSGVQIEPTSAWHVQMMQQTAATWQRLRAMCSAGQQDTTCCEAAAGVVKSCAAGQAPKSCCCAKACACCETCKEKKTTAQAQPMRAPLTLEMQRMIAGLHGITQPQPPPYPMVAVPPCMPPAYGPGIVQVMPVPNNVRVVHVVQVAHQTKPVHLVTPDLEAHCEQMHHRGDTVILEGNVLLVCKKHAMPIRIEAQRVIVNMKDGSFTVESGAFPPPAVKVLETRTGNLMLGDGVNCDNVIRSLGVRRTPVDAQPMPSTTGYYVPTPRVVLPNCSEESGCGSQKSLLEAGQRLRTYGESLPQIQTAPSTAPNLETLFRFWAEMYR